MEAKPKKANAFFKRLDRLEQALPGGGKRLKISERSGKALRPRKESEISEFDFQSHRSSSDLGSGHPVPGIKGDPRKLCRQSLVVDEILVERSFRAYGFVGSIGLDFAFVDPPADPVIPGSRASELKLERGKAPLEKVSPGKNSKSFHLLRSHRPDAMKAGNLQEKR